MGEMLGETERANGKRTDLIPIGHRVEKLTLAEIGVTPNESARAQKIAALPEETFEELKQGKTGMHDGPDPEAARRRRETILTATRAHGGK